MKNYAHADSRVLWYCMEKAILDSEAPHLFLGFFQVMRVSSLWAISESLFPWSIA